MIELRVDVRSNFASVVGGEFCPMHRRLVMVGGVEAAIEEQPVGEPAGDVASVVVVRILLASLVLHKIDPDEKRFMRRLYPDIVFDWKKITAQLACKRGLPRWHPRL